MRAVRRFAYHLSAWRSKGDLGAIDLNGLQIPVTLRQSDRSNADKLTRELKRRSSKVNFAQHASAKYQATVAYGFCEFAFLHLECLLTPSPRSTELDKSRELCEKQSRCSYRKLSDDKSD